MINPFYVSLRTFEGFQSVPLDLTGLISLKRIDQSSPRHELVDNGGFTNFRLLLIKQNARAMAQILGSLSYKV